MAKIYKSFLFDGKKSEDFDVYITGSAVYDAPDRDVELIDIPGRNGALVIDRNKFKNITVTYPAGTYAKDQADFSLKMEALRNFLASRKGYKRLEDEYNLDEFRLGIYKDGLQVNPVLHGKAGQFSLVFDCKPQRYLKSGEAPTEFTADGEIFNPTFFDASPLLEVEGRGEILLNGFPIEINVDPLGELPLFNAVMYNGSSASNTFDDVPYASGDDIHVRGSEWSVEVAVPGSLIYNPTPTGTGVTAVSSLISGGSSLKLTASLADAVFTEGTPETKTYSADVNFTASNVAYNAALAISLIYDGAKRIRASASLTLSDNAIRAISMSTKLGAGTVDSTKTSLNEILFIDCELGEVYDENGQSYNNAVSLGADLPVLSPGKNIVELANTIDALRIIPRWWRI